MTDARARDAAQALLPDGPSYVGFAPGAGGQEKRWPLERYLALAQRTQAAGGRPVFFFGPDEAAEANIQITCIPNVAVSARASGSV